MTLVNEFSYQIFECSICHAKLGQLCLKTIVMELYPICYTKKSSCLNAINANGIMKYMNDLTTLKLGLYRTSRPEVRRILKFRTVRKPDVFLPGCWTFNTVENRKKSQKKFSFFFSLIFFFKNFDFDFFFDCFSILKSPAPGRKMSSLRTVRILKICRTSGRDVR